MNKLFTKIIGATLGFAMAIGVGAAVANNRYDIVPVRADYGTPETLSCTAGTVSNNQMSFSTTSFNIVHAKGTGSSFASNSPWRVYANNTVTISSKDGTTRIGKVEFVHSSTYYSTISCTSPTGGTVTMATTSGGTSTWTIADASAATSVIFKITGSSQSRWTSVKIYPVTGGSTPTTCSLTYNANKPSDATGTVEGMPTTNPVTEIEAGTNYTLTTTLPTLEGYKCLGWGTSSDAKSVITEITVSTDKTVYAIWENKSLVMITADYLGFDTTGITNTTTTKTVSGIKYGIGTGGNNAVKATSLNKTNATNRLSDDLPLLIGKNGAYIYNDDAFEYPIKKIEVYSNYGASTSVDVGVELSSSKLSSSMSTSTTHKQTMSTANHVYDYTYETMSLTYKFFRFQVLNGNNAQVQIKITFDTSPTVSISTSSTDLIYDGSNTQTVAFTSSVANFSDDAEDIAYEWRTSNSSVISVTGAGSDSTANLKIVGEGSASITVYALGLSGDEATSAAVALSVTNETYDGFLSITTSGDLLAGSSGYIEYSLTGNTHEMNTFEISSTDEGVVYVDYNSSEGKFEYLAGDTPNATATITITLSSSTYTLESYSADLNVTLIDGDAVASVSTNYNTRNVKIGGNNLSFTATVTLVGGGDATGKQVTWKPADTGVCTITPSANTLTGTVVPINVGSTTVRVASVDDPTKYHDVTVNVSGPDSKTLNSITITKGDGAVTSYYDDDTEVNTTGLSLTANFVNETYPSYSENVAVAVNASGVVWTLDLTNEKVKVAYTVNEITVYDDFSITVDERPTSVTFLATDHTDFADGKVYTLNPFTISVTNYVQTPTDNVPTYNSTNEDVRLYNGDYFEITCDDTVETIDSIEYVYTTKDSGKGDSYTLTLNDGDASSSYTKSGTTLTFTNTTKIRFTAGANQIRFKSFTINYTKVAAQDLDVESVDIADSSISIESGDTYNLTVSVLPVNARDISVTWESDDTSVAEVDKNGLVTGVAPGTCTITATSKDQPSIYDTCSVTVTAGPKVNHTFLSSVDSSSGSILDLNDTHFTLTKTGGSYTGYDAVKGAQFSSGSDSINVQFQSTDIAFATKNLKVIVHASKAGSKTGSIKAYLGTTQIGSTGTLTTSDTEFTFEYSGTATSTVTLSDLLKIELDNTGGAVYIKSIKVYSDATASNIENFMNSQLHMGTYDKDGTYGSTAGDGSCKTWWNDVATAYSNLTAGQKALFTSESQYSAARARLSEWARINNYSFNTETGALVQNARISPLGFVTTTSNVAAVIVILSMMSIAAVGCYFLLRKRKED